MPLNRKTHPDNRCLANDSTHGGHAPELAPVVRHLLDRVVRRAARGERDAVALLARDFSKLMIAHAEENLARLDMDAEDVVQAVFVALLERALVEPPRAACAVSWLLDRVALFAQPDLAA